MVRVIKMENKRIIFHVDVNNAFLSWDAAYRIQHGSTIDLRDIPSIVGGNQATRHGIVLAKSIPTKKFNIITGESIWQAKQKCPNLVVVPPNYHLYMQCSSALIKILEEYSDKLQIYSIDECFIDFTKMRQLLGDPLTVANQLKSRIKKELGFTVNIGISSNKLLAKMAGELKKPDLVHTLYPEEIKNKMWILPVEDLFMVGRATTLKLHKLGIYTIGQLAQTDIELLKYTFKKSGIILWNYSNGIENSFIENKKLTNIKSISNSTTMHFDVEDKETAFKVLLSLVETVAMRLRHSGYYCRIISVLIKTSDLHSYSHQKKLVAPLNCTNAIYDILKKLFIDTWKGEPIRLLGIKVSDLTENEFYQFSLFEKSLEKQLKIDSTIDSIRMKYGSKSIFRSCFVWSGLSPLEGGVSEEFTVMSSIL